MGIGANYTDLTWEAGSPMPTQEALDAWIAANPTYTPAQDSQITVLAFRNRFLPAEKVAIDLTSIDDTTSPMAQRQLASAIRVMFADMAVATSIHLDDPQTIGGVQTLEYYGLIGVGRADEILRTPVDAHERPGTI
jgi:hypothetical protein